MRVEIFSKVALKDKGSMWLPQVMLQDMRGLLASTKAQ